jgi:hypothetical protein
MSSCTFGRGAGAQYRLQGAPPLPENPFAGIYSESLIKTFCQHLLLLIGFDTLIYQKYYDAPPILVGHQRGGTSN